MMDALNIAGHKQAISNLPYAMVSWLCLCLVYLQNNFPGHPPHGLSFVGRYPFKGLFQQVALLTECHSSSKRFAGGCLSQAFPMHRLRGPIARYCAAQSRGYLKTGNQSPQARSSQSSSVQASQAGHCEKDCQPSWPVLKTKIMTAFPAESIVGFPAVSRIASPVPVCKIAGFPTVSNSPSLLWQISLWDARTKDQSKTEAVDR